MHVDGIQLLNRRQGHGLVRRYDGAVGHPGPSCPAGNRGGNPRVAQVDPSRLDARLGLFDGRPSRGHRCPVATHLRLGHLQRGLGHIGIGYGPVAIGGGDGLVLEQILQPPAVNPGKVQCGLLPRYIRRARRQGRSCPVGGLPRDIEIRRRVVHRSLEQSRFDLIEHVAGFDVRSFREETLLHQAAHLRPDLSDQVSRCATRQLCSQHNPLGLNRYR